AGAIPHPIRPASMGSAATPSRPQCSPRSLHGKVVVITGGTAGVGRATARLFTKHGAKVALVARDAAGLENTRAAIELDGGEAAVISADVADAGAVFAAARACEERLGPIDIWVNNAMATVF